MGFLAASIASLAAGPLSYWLAGRLPWARRVLDTVVILAVGSLVLFHVLPETLAAAGWKALFPLLVGLLGPTAVERTSRNLERQAHTVVMVLLLVGLFAHALLDGVALVLPRDEHSLLGMSLPLAIVLHRLSMSLLIWSLVRPSYGVALAILCLGIEGTGTVVGFFSAQLLVTYLESSTVVALQALVVGSLLHVVVDRRHHLH